MQTKPYKTARRLTKFSHLLVAGLLSVFAHSVGARDYKVETLIIENLNDNVAYESYQYQDIKDLESEAKTWQIDPSMMLEYAEEVDNAEDFALRKHYSWGQESLPSSESAIFRITEPLINGHVKIYAKQLLFANIDLDFNGYRMIEKRRIKLNEVHYFDHPKFGVLLQVSRLEEEEDDDVDAKSATP